jgi:hypothetical protein
MNTTNEYNERVSCTIENQLDGSPPPYARYVRDTIGSVPDFAGEADEVQKATIAYICSKPQCYGHPTTASTEVARLKSAVKSVAKLPAPVQNRSRMGTYAHHVEYLAVLYCDYVRERRELWRGYSGPKLDGSLL